MQPGSCPIAVLKSLPAIDTKTKKAAYAAFLEIELIRRYRLQRMRHEVHATNKGVTMLSHNFSSIFRNVIKIIQHL